MANSTLVGERNGSLFMTDGSVPAYVASLHATGYAPSEPVEVFEGRLDQNLAQDTAQDNGPSMEQ